MDEAKKEYYRLLTHLEAAQTRFDSKDQLGPIIGADGKPDLVETAAVKEQLRKAIVKLLPQLHELKAEIDAKGS